MGSSGSFLKSGGFKSRGWEQVGTINGVKVLRKIGLNGDDKGNLPLYSNTPGTAYVLLDENGVFSQFRQYGEDRRAMFDIDFGKHKTDYKYLHFHCFKGKTRSNEPETIALPGSVIINKKMYERYKGFLKGVKL